MVVLAADSAAEVLVVSDIVPASPDADATPKTTTRVLFLGNSYTYFNNMPAALKTFGEDPQSPVFFAVGQHVLGGANWLYHDTREGGDVLINQGWDHVVLQDQSGQPWGSVGTKPELISLDGKVRNMGGTSMMFMTWARSPQSVPELTGFKMNLAVNNYYERHGAAVNAPVAPIGRAWERVLRTTKLTLHKADGSHPNAHGTYLTACVLYATLTGRSPLGLGSVGYNLPEDDRATLQRAAWETVRERQRLASPAVASWPLSLGDPTHDLIPGQLLMVGDTAGPDGAAGGATGFGYVEGQVKFASLPYIPGMNAPEFTFAFHAARDDWGEPTSVPQTLVAKSFGYRLTQDATTLTAAIYTTAQPEPVTVSHDVAGLSGGWHELALTYDGATFALWVDGQQATVAETSGAVRYYDVNPDEDLRFNGIALGVTFTDVFEGVNDPEDASGFTGSMARLRLYERALTTVELQAL